MVDEYIRYNFGRVDSVTERERRDFLRQGFAVVFYDGGMTHQEALEIAGSAEVVRELASA